MTLSDLIASLQDAFATPKNANGFRHDYTPQEQAKLNEPFLYNVKHTSSGSVSPDFQPVAPLQNYVPEWKRAKMANDAKWSQYADRLKTGPLGQ